MAKEETKAEADEYLSTLQVYEFGSFLFFRAFYSLSFIPRIVLICLNLIGKLHAIEFVLVQIGDTHGYNHDHDQYLKCGH